MQLVLSEWENSMFKSVESIEVFYPKKGNLQNENPFIFRKIFFI